MIVSRTETDSLAKHLAKLFEQAGHQVVIHAEYNKHPDIVISLLGATPVNTIEEAKTLLTENFKLARAMASNPIKGYIVIENVDGHLGLKNKNDVRSVMGGCAGLLKTASQEWEKGYYKLIDIELDKMPEEKTALNLYHEITNGASQLEVGISSDGSRLIPALSSKSIKTIDPHRFNNESVILVSGGARGITAACVIALAKKTPCHFILFGRSQLIEEEEATKQLNDQTAIKQKLIEIGLKSGEKITPKEITQKIQKIMASRELMKNLNTLRSLGAKADYFVCDIGDKENVASVCANVRKQCGKIDGFIHGAGVLVDKLIKDKTDEQFNTVFNTKVNGYINLISATKNDHLKLIAIFSSVAARFGNKGQVDYAMANEVLNKLAQYEQHKRGKNCIVKAINWGPWEGGMVDETLQKIFASRGISLIPLEQGANAFVNEVLSTDLNNSVEVVIGSKIG